jgi:hypothetical protein
METYDVQRELWPFESDPGDYAYQPQGDLCRQLQKLLEKIYNCKFAFGETDDPLLPALPGLTVLGGIAIPTPLSVKHARRFTDRAIASAAGVSRWTLPAQQVMLKNPQWDERMAELGALLRGQLGGNDVLDVELEELVVYGPGGRLDRTKDADDAKRGVVARIVVQLPTLHTGGDLVVFDHEDIGRTYRFDFGAEKGTAAFKPSYAVYVAGAEYAVEAVKSGYCLRLVYSVRPPRGKTPVAMRTRRSLLQLELRGVVTALAQSNETFALLLSSKYDTYRDFENTGCAVLVDGDRSWFHALKSANDQLPLASRLKLHVVELEHTTLLKRNVDGDALRMWEFKSEAESAVWFSTGGKLLGDSSAWTQQLNFLNPTDTWPRTLWTKHMRRDGEFDEQTIQYRAFAIVGWSLAYDVKHSIALMGENGALMAMLADDGHFPAEQQLKCWR